MFALNIALKKGLQTDKTILCALILETRERERESVKNLNKEETKKSYSHDTWGRETKSGSETRRRDVENMQNILRVKKVFLVR
jgi:hypothetical protein